MNIFVRWICCLACLVASLAIAQQSITVLVDGDDVEFPDAKPMMSGGRVMVPLRGVFESIGSVVEWDQSQGKIRIHRGESLIQLQIGLRKAFVGAEPKRLDIAPQVNKEGRVYVPLRAVSELLGATVDWNRETSTVNIYSTSE